MNNNQRKRIIDDVIQLCQKKQWCQAEELCVNNECLFYLIFNTHKLIE